MQAIILAAGYATRLHPLTETMAKPLLPVGGRPMIDYLYAKLADVTDLTAVHVVTNHRFAAAFTKWAAVHSGPPPLHIHDDGTRTNAERLGAIGDIQLVVARAGLQNEDLLVVAGDNLFDFSLADFVRFWQRKGDGSCLAVYTCPDLELVKQYSAVTLATNDRVCGFVEKPAHPTTRTVGIATYLYHRAHVPLIDAYLREGHSPDQPGNFMAWLYRQAPVYGYRIGGEWRDIGDLEQLRQADNAVRRRQGLAEREVYRVDVGQASAQVAGTAP
jgi:glucose-1-phosphate thymidylyltransferase